MTGVPGNQYAMLVTREWPSGFCPRHVLESVQCGSPCMHVRLEFAAVARDLAAEWPRWEQRRQAKRIARNTAA